MLPRTWTPLYLALGLVLLALAFLWATPFPPVLGRAPQLSLWFLLLGSALTLAGGVPILRSLGRD